MQAKNIPELEKAAEQTASELKDTRKQILENEKGLKALVSKKAGLEDSLNSLLRQKFGGKKRSLSAAKSRYKRQETGLKKRISSLSQVLEVYNAKRQKIESARKHYTALKKQLDSLNRKLEGGN